MAKKRTVPTPGQVIEVESWLQSSLQRIEPGDEFVNRLRYRLENPAEMELETASPLAVATARLLLATAIIGLTLASGLWLLHWRRRYRARLRARSGANLTAG